MTHAITLRFKQHKDNRNAELKARLDAIEKSMRDGLEREARLMARCVELKAELEAQRVPLTDEQMLAAIRPLCADDWSAMGLLQTSQDEYRAIEAAHGIGTKEGGQ